MSRIMTKALLAATAAIGIAAASQAQPPKYFIQDAIRGHQTEMMLAGLATERAASPGIRRYGRELQRDHSAAKQDAIRVARRMGVPNPIGMTPEGRRTYSRLKMLHGRAFDRAFLRHVTNEHREDIAEYRDQARSGAPTARYAERTLPTLREHLRAAERLG